MKSSHRLLALMFGGALGAAAIWGVQAQSKPSTVYAVIEIDQMNDADAYMKAVTAREPKATQSVGGRFVIRTSKPVAIDGEEPPARFAIIAFDNEEKFKEWVNLTAIKEINDVRLKVSKSRAFMVEGLTN